MNHIILVLGAPNDESGNLSQIALDRLECAYSLYTNNEHTRILCTGGFGEHFNKSIQPHAYHAKRFLISKGVREADFLEFASSSNTVEDFRKSKSIIEKESPAILLIVTSDFHMERVKILHDLILNYPAVVFIPAKSSLMEIELIPLINHEKKAIKQLRDNNFVLY